MPIYHLRFSILHTLLENANREKLKFHWAPHENHVAATVNFHNSCFEAVMDFFIYIF